MKRKKSKKRNGGQITVLGAALVLLTALSLTVLGAGAFRLISLKKGLDDSARQAEIRLIQAASTDESALVEDGKEAASAIAVLTFRGNANTATPVYYGTDAASLEKGAGQAEDTAPLNTPGNAVLFGHRDSAFRPMAELAEGDTLSLTTAGKTVDYLVERIYITDPDDPHIYDEAEETTLTLVTCYPFSFVGPAPERCVAIAKAV